MNQIKIVNLFRMVRMGLGLTKFLKIIRGGLLPMNHLTVVVLILFGLLVSIQVGDHQSIHIATEVF